MDPNKASLPHGRLDIKPAQPDQVRQYLSAVEAIAREASLSRDARVIQLALALMARQSQNTWRVAGVA